MIAASTPRMSTGCSVTSRASSGVRHHGQEVGAGAHRAILGQVAAGLAHHPHRRPLHRLAPAGAQEEIVHRVEGSARSERTSATSASTSGCSATAAGDHPAARAAAAVVGPTASNGGRGVGRRGSRQELGHGGTRDDEDARPPHRPASRLLTGDDGPVADHLVHLDSLLPEPSRQLVAADLAAGKEHRSRYSLSHHLRGHGRRGAHPPDLVLGSRAHGAREWS